jgi:hypothetical protein
MRILHDLIHSLAREEKKLFSVYCRKLPLKKLYQFYLSLEDFSRQEDNKIYTEHFSSTTQANYSILKSELYEEIVSILLYRTRMGIPYRTLPLTQLLAERGHWQGVNKLSQYAQNQGGSVNAFVGNLLELKSLCHTGQEELTQVEKLYSSAKANLLLLEKDLKEYYLEAKISVFENTESQDKIQSANELLEQIDTADVIKSTVTEFRIRKATQNSLFLFNWLKTLFETKSTSAFIEHLPVFYEMRYLLMCHAISNGDFLTADSISYRYLKTEVSKYHAYDFPFFTNCALFRFYENQSADAISILNTLTESEIPGVSNENLFFAYITKAQILASLYRHVPANELLEKCILLLPEGEYTPVWLITRLIVQTMDEKNQKFSRELSYYKKMLRKNQNLGKPEIAYWEECFEAILFGNKYKKTLNKTNFNFSMCIQPWIWQKAKISRAFYYDLLLEELNQQRKLVF